MTDKQKLARLIQSIETIIPYVTATLNPHCPGPVPGRSDWIQVHGGRAGSSTTQLESLLREARSFKEKNDGEP